MGKVGFRFLVVFFSWFGALIVFINFVGWSGAYVNLTSGSYVDWTNSYFGFESVSFMIRALNESIDSIPFLAVSNFTYHLQQFLDVCAFGIPEFLESISNTGVSIEALLKMLLYIFGGQPLYAVAYLIILLGHVLWYALNFIFCVMFALSGAYNVKFDNPLTPSDVVDMYRITVPLMV